MTLPSRIIVTGARRSGTTVAAAIIASSPDTPPFPGECQLLTRWVESHAWAQAHFPIAGEPFFASPGELSAVTREMLERFWRHCAERAPEATAMVLKSPELAPVFAAAHELLSPARFVVTLRDPRDQVASEWRVMERRRSVRDVRLLEQRDFATLSDVYVRYYSAIVEAVARGIECPVFVRFEDLVTRPEPAIAELGRQLGLDLGGFNHREDWPSLAPSYWSYGSSPSDTPHYGKPLDAARAGAWREVMSEAEAETILDRCSGTTEQLERLVRAAGTGRAASSKARAGTGDPLPGAGASKPDVSPVPDHDDPGVMPPLSSVGTGREPACRDSLPVNRPVPPPRSRFLALVQGLLDSSRFTNDGPLVRSFEQQVAERCQVPHFVATCNGTQALELLARVEGLKGEVVVPAFTFVATAHAFRNAGLRVVFCDVDPTTMNIDPESCEAALSGRASAICGVHLWGNAAPVSRLAELAARRDVPVYYDAAHAFGCTSSRQPIGGHGRAEVFSFHATKILHTFEGGGIATHSEELARELRLARNFGFSGYDTVTRLGTNAKMSEISAACGIAILETLDQWIDNATRVHETYRQRLSDLEGLAMVRPAPGERCNHQYVVASVGASRFGMDRDTFVRALHAEGVLARRYFHPGVHRMQPYAEEGPTRVPLPHSEALAESVIVFPAGGALSVADAHRACDAIERVWSHRHSAAALRS